MPTTYQVLSPAPYGPIENQQFDHLELSIIQNQFAGVEEEPGNFSISFIGCAFNKLIINNPEAIPFPDISIGFTGCYIGEIEVKEVVSNNVRLNFLSCYLNGKVENSVLENVAILNCYIHSALFLMKLRTVEISLTSKTLNRQRWIELLRKMGLTSIKKLRVQKQSYHVHQCRDVRFTTDFDHIASALGFLFSLHLFYGEEQEDKTTHIERGYFAGLSLNGTASGKIKIDRVRTDAIYLHNFSPQEETTLFDLRPISPAATDTKFEIHQCDLDNIWFDTIAFGQFANLAIYRSKLNKTKFTGCTYPTDFGAYSAVENIHYPDKRSDDYDKDLYEMFLQLKNALDGTGNGYESLKFQAFSLRALNKVKGLSSQDQFLLRLNNLSNRHGLSIARPFLWFVGLSILFYMLYLLSLGRIFTRQPFDPTLIGYYFSFLDITHRNDFLVNKDKFTASSLAIDYFAKLVFGYLIYQFIAAFRKYSKKL
jgi:hypothetical protein